MKMRRNEYTKPHKQLVYTHFYTQTYLSYKEEKRNAHTPAIQNQQNKLNENPNTNNATCQTLYATKAKQE